MDREIKIILAYTITLLSILVCSISAGDDISRNGKCDYKAIVSYFPARVIICELFKERW